MQASGTVPPPQKGSTTSPPGSVNRTKSRSMIFQGTQQMALRPEEQHAAEVFERWLAEQGTRVKWEAVEADPPDLCFIVAQEHEERWAVEVTTLVQYVA